MESTRTIGVVLLLVTISYMFPFTSATYLYGVCYGANGNDLPSPSAVVAHYKKHLITKMRLFEPIHEMLEALRKSDIEVTIGTRNEDLTSLANSPEAAINWVQTNIIPYFTDVTFTMITAGNEVIPGNFAQYVVGAMSNLDQALVHTGLKGRIRISTVLSGASVTNSYPPSQGTFTNPDIMSHVAAYLSANGSPLYVNVYPYFAYSRDPANVPLNFAVFKSTEPQFTDEGHAYYNLYDATLDAYYAALEKINFPNLKLAVGETGWPFEGNEPYTSVQNAHDYTAGLITQVATSNGTPRRPSSEPYDLFIFEMFVENMKPAGEERGFGLYYADFTPTFPFLPQNQ